MNDMWIFTKNQLPEIGKEVLCFYVIDRFEYYTVGKIVRISSEITGEPGNYKETKSIDWKDGIEPLFWMEFPLVELMPADNE